jgi:hypothetical protein
LDTSARGCALKKLAGAGDENDPESGAAQDSKTRAQDET